MDKQPSRPMAHRTAGRAPERRFAAPRFRLLWGWIIRRSEAPSYGAAIGGQRIPASRRILPVGGGAAALHAHHGTAGADHGGGAGAGDHLWHEPSARRALYPNASVGGAVGCGVPCEHCNLGESGEKSESGAADGGVYAVFSGGISERPLLWGGTQSLCRRGAGGSGGEPVRLLAAAESRRLSDRLGG